MFKRLKDVSCTQIYKTKESNGSAFLGLASLYTSLGVFFFYKRDTNTNTFTERKDNEN